ncbi:nucleoid-associated protein [[Clostridium] fimetarium]|uniref:37-kD nucleoid-associated bacterial protein n=1 Tax=[Clostridium] fimetarium TaxID=99656 RepID=A0A1I0MC13_9FIRM|nr:nucleoid-associated protein [[Clostridium] fimetarium]SEV84921.1 hypothetical protein SAMN05421659_101317 [[Clostridium] fimetarium]
MQTITKSIRIIDYEGNNVYTRETPESFDEYITELISHVSGNTSVREFKTRSSETEVISCICQILSQRANNDLVITKTDIIAQRLLAKEIEAQDRVARLDTNVQKGSLIQALLYDEESEMFTYLLAKVEHSDFVDDSDFTFKSGFSKDKKTFWKSCLIDLPNGEATEYYAKIYSNTVAKYWSDNFLELDEMVSDESNTSNAFKAIESSLNRNIRGIAPRDYTIIRNAIISYFKNHEHFDYDQMIGSVIGGYHTTDLPQDKLESFKTKLASLPDQKHFDRQFNSVPSVINARIKRLFDVNDGIQIKITDEVRNIEETISAYREADGTRYIKIKTNNDLTYRNFYKIE